MAHAKKSISINKPASVVFAYLLEPTNNAEWRPGVISSEPASEEPMSVGSRVNQTMQGPGGRTIKGDYEITELEPDGRIAFKVVSGPARPIGVYTLESDGEVTTLTFELAYQPRGLKRLLSGMIQKTMDAEVAQLTALKRRLEA